MVAPSRSGEEAVRGPGPPVRAEELTGSERGQTPRANPPTPSCGPGKNRRCVGTRAARRRGPPAAAPAHRRGPGGVGGGEEGALGVRRLYLGGRRRAASAGLRQPQPREAF